MKIELSSRLTLVYKIFGLVWGILVTVLIIMYAIGTANPFVLLLLLVFLLPTIITYKLSKVTFDDNFVYVKTWLTEEKFELRKVKSINEGDLMAMDPFFQLEIISDDNKTIKKIEFAPKQFESLEYFFRKKYGGRLLVLKRQVERAKDNEQTF